MGTQKKPWEWKLRAGSLRTMSDSTGPPPNRAMNLCFSMAIRRRTVEVAAVARLLASCLRDPKKRNAAPSAACLIHQYDCHASASERKCLEKQSSFHASAEPKSSH